MWHELYCLLKERTTALLQHFSSDQIWQKRANPAKAKGKRRKKKARKQANREVYIDNI